MTYFDPSPPTNAALERLLSETHLRLRQGKITEAKERLEKAKAIAPDSPAVMEMEGDLAFAQHNFKAAEAIYHQAMTRVPQNTKLEEKFARTLLKVHEAEFAYLRNYDDSLWSNHVPRKPIASALLSALLPGIGQLYNGDFVIGAIMLCFSLLIDTNLVWAYDKLWLPLNKSNDPNAFLLAFGAFFHGNTLVWFLIFIALWVYGIINAWLVAKDSR